MSTCQESLIPFSPDQSLVTVAGTPRINGQNLVDFIKTLDLDAFSQNPSGFVQNLLSGYLLGLLAPAIAVIVLFIIWSCSLCFAKCTCAKWPCCKGDSVIGLIVFLTFCAASCLGWFIAIGANAEAQAGVLGIVNAFDCSFAAVDTALVSVDQVLSFADDTADLIQTAAQTCIEIADILSLGNATSTTLIPDLNLSIPISDFLGPVTELISPVKDTFDQIETTVDPIFNIIRDAMATYNVIFIIFIIVVIVLLTIFALTTTVRVIRVLGRHDILARWTRLTSLANFFGKASSTIIFVVGYIVLLLLVVMIALISILVVAGSDLCVPSPTANAIEIAETYLKDQNVLTTPTLCEDPTFQYVCHYLQCVGTNPIKNVTDELISTLNTSALDVAQNVVDETQNALLTIADELSIVEGNISDAGIVCNGALAFCADSACETPCELGIGGSPDDCPNFNSLCLLNQTVYAALDQGDLCLNDVETVITQGLGLPNLLQSVLDNALCENITPLYQKLVEQEICNNLISGLALNYIAFILAAFSLMGAMFVFRLMDLRPYQEGELPVTTAKVATAVPVDPKAHQL